MPPRLSSGAQQALLWADSVPQESPISAQRLGELIREVENDRLAAAVDAESETGRGAAVRIGKIIAELQDVAGCGAPPAVDGLERVTDRGHREAETPGSIRAGEQPLQQMRLGCRGVLILVEQYHPEPLAQLPGHFRGGIQEANGLRHLVGELGEASIMLEPAIIIDQAEQFCAGGGRPGRRAHRGRRTTTASGFHRLQLLGERLILGQDLSAVDQMTAQLGIQLEQAVGNRCGLPLAQPIPRQNQ